MAFRIVITGQDIYIKEVLHGGMPFYKGVSFSALLALRLRSSLRFEHSFLACPGVARNEQ
jgi:hypothetical protein